MSGKMVTAALVVLLSVLSVASLFLGVIPLQMGAILCTGAGMSVAGLIMDVWYLSEGGIRATDTMLKDLESGIFR